MILTSEYFRIHNNLLNGIDFQLIIKFIEI